MPIGKLTAERKAAQHLAATTKKCKGCPSPIPLERKSEWCSKECYKRNWMRLKGKDYLEQKKARSKERDKQRAIERHESLNDILTRGAAAVEAGRHPSALTTHLVTKKPIAQNSAVDVANPSAREMRDFIKERYGNDGGKLIELLEQIAFTLPNVPIKVRVECAKELLDRGWGKTTQSIAVAAVAPIFAVPTEGQAQMLPDLGNEEEPPQITEPVIEVEAEEIETDDNDNQPSLM